MNLIDAAFRRTLSLPNGAATAYSDPIEIGAAGKNITHRANCELIIEVPAVTTEQLDDEDALTYFIEEADDSDFTDPVLTNPALIVQTGADEAGAAAQTVRFRPASTTRPFLRFGVTNSGDGDALEAEAVVNVAF
ncbi:MAG: hypothetical protein KF861_10055 [Planctomycetaceae bacterium]|nr:hypothetical protein [Planctomycetaceae bacterium]